MKIFRCSCACWPVLLFARQHSENSGAAEEEGEGDGRQEGAAVHLKVMQLLE